MTCTVTVVGFVKRYQCMGGVAVIYLAGTIFFIIDFVGICMDAVLL